MTPEERYAESQAAQAALDKFLGPAFDAVEREYTERMLEVAGKVMKPGESAAALDKLATALKVSRAVRGQIEAIARDGVAAEHEIDRAKQIQQIRPYKRRILGI